MGDVSWTRTRTWTYNRRMHRVRVRQADVFLRPVRTRMPFRYGKAVVTEDEDWDF